jgi:hypothetical protein
MNSSKKYLVQLNGKTFSRKSARPIAFAVVATYSVESLREAEKNLEFVISYLKGLAETTPGSVSAATLRIRGFELEAVRGYISKGGHCEVLSWHIFGQSRNLTRGKAAEAMRLGGKTFCIEPSLAD